MEVNGILRHDGIRHVFLLQFLFCPLFSVPSRLMWSPAVSLGLRTVYAAGPNAKDAGAEKHIVEATPQEGTISKTREWSKPHSPWPLFKNDDQALLNSRTQILIYIYIDISRRIAGIVKCHPWKRLDITWYNQHYKHWWTLLWVEQPRTFLVNKNLLPTSPTCSLWKWQCQHTTTNHDGNSCASLRSAGHQLGPTAQHILAMKKKNETNFL